MADDINHIPIVDIYTTLRRRTIPMLDTKQLWSTWNLAA